MYYGQVILAPVLTVERNDSVTLSKYGAIHGFLNNVEFS